MADNEPCIIVGQGVTLTMTTGELLANSAHTGLGIQLRKGSSLYLDNVEVRKFQSSVIYARTVPDLNVQVKGCTFRGNPLGQSGVIYLYGSANGNLTIIDSIVSNNTARAVAFRYASNLNFANTQVNYNEHTKDGAGLIVTDVDKMIISGSSFKYNKAGRKGGGILLDSNVKSGLIKSTEILYNEAGGDGGGLYYGNEGSSVKVESDVVVKGNVAGGSGAGVYCSGSSGITLAEIDDETSGC